jgi:hypothetical protein
LEKTEASAFAGRRRLERTEASAFAGRRRLERTEASAFAGRRRLEKTEASKRRQRQGSVSTGGKSRGDALDFLMGADHLIIGEELSFASIPPPRRDRASPLFSLSPLSYYCCALSRNCS